MPPPWTVKQNEGSFVVTDGTGFPLAYVYFDDGSRGVSIGTSAGSRMTRDQARRVAANIAKLPELLWR